MNYDATPERNRKKALFITLGIHLLLAFALFLGVQWKTEHAAIEEVELWDRPSVSLPPPTPAPPPPVIQREPPPPLIKPDIALKPDKKEPPPPKEKPKEAAKPEKPVRNEDFRDLLAEEERDLRQNMANAELAGRQASQRKAAQNSWTDKIKGKIRGNVILPPNITGNPRAEFYVRLLPTGEIVGRPRLVRSSGNTALDEAIERAIQKSSPLPLPDDMAVFVPVLSPFHYCPYENPPCKE